MNRIYQGRVTKVEIPRSPDEQSRTLENWQDVLWQHHELFQNAVNYYLVCLLSLATDPKSEMGKIRERIIKDGDPSYIWGPFTKKGVKRKGLRESIARYLTPHNNSPI